MRAKDLRTQLLQARRHGAPPEPDRHQLMDENMGLHFENLDDLTRQYMLQEIEIDAAEDIIYRSPWLTEAGQRQWVDLLKAAAGEGDDDTLAAALRRGGYIETHAQRRKPTGGFTTVKVPHTAAETMAGEFNLFYIRALCRRAIADGKSHLQVYRARTSGEPRPESIALIGTMVHAIATLDDLRQTHGTTPALGFPPGPNSGLSARLLNEGEVAVGVDGIS